MTTLFTNIRCLAGTHARQEPLRGADLSDLRMIENAFLLVEGGSIAAFGAMEELSEKLPKLPAINIDATGQIVLPCWCDSHTHLVFAGSREGEFVNRIRGMSYAEIAARGGGILNSAKALESASEDGLFEDAWKRLSAVARLGTGAIEIKSGYGLSVASELKMLRVIQRLKRKSPLAIKATFLAAHAYPSEYRDDHAGYIHAIIHEMLPVVAEEKLADYVDVFCETGFFSPGEMIEICKAASRYGLKPKLHVNQLNSIGGVRAGQEVNALSLDHLETVSDEDIALLANPHWPGICTLLPSAAFFLGADLPPARTLIKQGAAVALASDYNPGSSPSGNMNLVVALACIQMKLLPAEAINAATMNGACAMECGDVLGSIAAGKQANITLTKPVPSVDYLPYAFGTNLVDKVMINGTFI